MVTLLAAFLVGLPAWYRLIDRETTSEAEETFSSSSASNDGRSEVTSELEQYPGFHLVFVKYHDDAPIQTEWVYNSAELTASRVLVAHDLGPDRNAALTAALPLRSIWLVELSKERARLDRYRAVVDLSVSGRRYLLSARLPRTA